MKSSSITFSLYNSFEIKKPIYLNRTVRVKNVFNMELNIFFFTYAQKSTPQYIKKNPNQTEIFGLKVVLNLIKLVLPSLIPIKSFDEPVNVS